MYNMDASSFADPNPHQSEKLDPDPYQSQSQKQDPGHFDEEQDCRIHNCIK